MGEVLGRPVSARPSTRTSSTRRKDPFGEKAEEIARKKADRQERQLQRAENKGRERGSRKKDKTKKEPGVAPENAEILDLLGSKYASAEDVASVLSSLKSGEHQLHRPRERSVAITALVRRQMWPEALALFEVLKVEKPERGVFNSAIAACAKGGHWEGAVGLLQDIRKAGLDPDMISYNLAMSACEQARNWEQGLVVLDEMQEWRRRDVFSYNVALSMCAQGRQWQRGLELMDEMILWNCQPYVETYDMAIDLASEGAAWEKSLHYLANMWKSNVLPRTSTYEAIIKACSKADRWEESLAMLREMSRKGFSPGEAAYKHVIEACEKSGKADLQSQLRKEADILRPAKTQR